VRYAYRRKEAVAVLQYPVMYRYAYSRAIPGNTVLNVLRVPVALRVRVYSEYAIVPPKNGLEPLNYIMLD
jgi:hypothetical protein